LGVLLCEQYFDFAQELADTYCVMERGEVVAHGLGANMTQDGVRQLVAI
jgi:urea transport system ATP-binding protein